MEDPNVHSDAIIAIQRLLKVIDNSQGKMETLREILMVILAITPSAGTIARLRDEITKATKEMTAVKTASVSVSSGCELFLRFITLTSLEQSVKHMYL
jgi:translation initiation factor eIF-2B subunit alpha